MEAGARCSTGVVPRGQRRAPLQRKVPPAQPPECQHSGRTPRSPHPPATWTCPAASSRQTCRPAAPAGAGRGEAPARVAGACACTVCGGAQRPATALLLAWPAIDRHVPSTPSAACCNELRPLLSHPPRTPGQQEATPLQHPAPLLLRTTIATRQKSSPSTQQTACSSLTPACTNLLKHLFLATLVQFQYHRRRRHAVNQGRHVLRRLA